MLHRIFLKNFAVFVIGALIYGGIEIAVRGFTHITMGLLGGISMLVIHISNDSRREGMNPLLQLGIVTFFITAIEFISGEILNVNLDMNIWDYSGVPLNIDGQVCLPFMALWAMLGAIGIVLDDLLRWKMFGEGMDFDYLNFRRNVTEYIE